MKKHFSIFLYIFSILFTSQIFAQEVDIVPYLKMIEKGNFTEVKSKFIDLKTDYPKSANLIFLEGVLTENGQDAVVLYQSLLDKYPKSAYADAALYRIYSYYFALGLYNTADKNLERLKMDYPDSPYIRMASTNVPQNNIEESNQGNIENKNTDQEFSYTVQAGAFTNSANAASLKDEIESVGMTSFIKEKNVAGTVFNVVYVGKFGTRQEAEDFLPIVDSRFRITGRVVEIDQ